MPTITFRTEDPEDRDLRHRAAAAGLSLSDYIRETLQLRQQAPDLAARIDEIDGRLRRIERLIEEQHLVE